MGSPSASTSSGSSSLTMPARNGSYPAEKTQEASNTLSRHLFPVPENPNHASTASVTASETSSEGSHHSKPPLLDFIGATCMGASSRFTSCFPCAVVNINDRDEYVVDKLSRESAMSAMYAKKEHEVPSAALNSGAGIFSLATLSDSSNSSPRLDGKQAIEEQDGNTVYVPLPRKSAQSNVTVHMPLIIDEDDDDDDSGIVDLREAANPLLGASEEVSEPSIEILPSQSLPTTTIPPKKRKSKFGMKFFERKKKM